MAASRPSAWSAVLRSALLFTPFLAVTLMALFFIGSETIDEGASAGRVVGLVLVSCVALLLGYQVLQSVRDLFSQPVETLGDVERSWTRNDFFLFRNSYVFVGRDVYRVPPDQFIAVDPGDFVRIVHYPHTGTVETFELVERADTKASGEDA